MLDCILEKIKMESCEYILSFLKRILITNVAIKIQIYRYIILYYIYIYIYIYI